MPLPIPSSQRIQVVGIVLIQDPGTLNGADSMDRKMVF